MDPGLKSFDSNLGCFAAAQAREPCRLQEDGDCITDLPSCQQQTGAKLGFLSDLPTKSDIVREFTPSWFCVTMGTGSVALSIMMFPWDFKGQDEIGMTVWALNVVLFITFSCLLLSRVVFFPRSLIGLARHPNQSLFVGAIPMAFSTITNGVVVFLIPRHGVAASRVAQALFWVNLPAVVVCTVLVPFGMVAVQHHAMPTMTAVWLLPVLPAFVAANTAGVVAMVGPDVGLSMSITLVGLVLLSIGFLLSYQITTIYYNRLICHSLPPREVIISSFLPVGPYAMTALALMDLAAAAKVHLPAYVTSLMTETSRPVDTEWLVHVTELVVVTAAILGLCIWGFSVWWLVLAVSSIADTVRQGIPFSLGWWGTVFPFGTVSIAACELASVLHNPGMRYIGAAAVVGHVMLWLVVVSLTAQRAWLGDLFHTPCLQATISTGTASKCIRDLPSGPMTPQDSGRSKLNEQRRGFMRRNLSASPAATLSSAQTLANLELRLDSIKRRDIHVASGGDAPQSPV